MTTPLNCMNWSSHGSQDEDKTLLQHLQRYHKGVSARKHRCTTAITTMWTESSWAFPESYTADDSWIVRSSDGGHGETKGLISPPPKWVSAQLLYVWVNARWRSRWCSQNLRRPFLQAGRFDYLFNYLHYAAQFFPYQECNITRHNFSPTRPGV